MKSIAIGDYGKVVEPGASRFSPDGRQIAFMLGGEAYVMPADGSKDAVKLSKAGTGYHNAPPVWSCDGNKLYLSYFNTDQQISKVFAASVNNKKKWSLVAAANTELWEPNLSPDQTAWLFSTGHPPESLPADNKRPDCAPIVIDAMVFKKDAKGYLETDAIDSVYVLDIKSGKSRRLTNNAGHDTQPAWSPDGTRIAFIREDLSKAEYRSDLCVVSSSGKTARAPQTLTTSPAERRSPRWSLDGKQIAYLRRDAKLGPYAVPRLAVLSLETGREQILAKTLDRTITSFRFSHDGSFIYFTFDNKGGSHLSRIRLSNNRIEELVAGKRYVNSFDLTQDGLVALNMKSMNDAIDIYIQRDQTFKRLTNLNADFFKSRKLGSKEQLFYKPNDGPRIQALITKPPGFDASKKYPAILRIHGGPVQQAKFGYDFFSQFLAAKGYVVVEPNPPGSTGRGQAFISRVKADWGYKKNPDVLGAIDEVVRLGYADKDKLAVMGYSYGGYMTNCIITVAPEKFRAAVSGAGHSFIAANYGHDIYLKWYNWGLGQPWRSKDRKRYEKLSPLNAAEKVKTPTLFLCGAQDWNVPILNAELFYQALRVRGIPTRLVVYPKAAHVAHWDDGGCENSKDYYTRVLNWLDHHVKGK